MQQQDEDILSNLEINLVQASQGKRFANYLIDLVVFYLLAFAVGIMLAIASPETIEEMDETGGYIILDRVVSLLMYGLYMFAIEAIFKGKSLGKMITGTKAVNEDGGNISVRTALLRGLSRAVPFEAFSALGTPSHPWHDKWTHTYVIDEKLSMRPIE